MSADHKTTAHGTTSTVAVDATPENAPWPHEMTLTFVLDEHGDLSTIRDKNGLDLHHLSISEKLRMHEKGVILRTVVPMTLLMHSNIDGTGKVCCIPSTGGWRYISCENARWPYEMTLTFVLDEHGELSTIKDSEHRELHLMSMAKKVEIHAKKGVKLLAVIPMTLMMHTNLLGDEKTCCIPSSGGWRYVYC